MLNKPKVLIVNMFATATITISHSYIYNLVQYIYGNLYFTHGLEKKLQKICDSTVKCVVLYMYWEYGQFVYTTGIDIGMSDGKGGRAAHIVMYSTYLQPVACYSFQEKDQSSSTVLTKITVWRI